MKKWFWVIIIAIILAISSLLVGLYYAGKQEKIPQYLSQTLESGKLQLKNANSVLEQAQKAFEIARKYSSNPQLYSVIVDKKYGSFNFNRPDNSFDFHSDEEKFDLLFSIIPETGEYKITKSSIKLMVDGDKPFSLSEILKIKDFPEVLTIAETQFQVYNQRYPDSGGSYFATLSQRQSQPLNWRFVYGVSKDYYNRVENARSMRVVVNSKSLQILEVRYPWQN
ncbi:MAG: hypothetical protein Q7S37_00150 [bacterium]|nr:hypothetical protein [bacterium]